MDDDGNTPDESDDKEDGRLPADQLQWKVKDLLETNNSFTSIGTGEEVSFNVPVFRTVNGFAEYLLVLIGKDSDDHAGTVTARFRVSIPNQLIDCEREYKFHSSR